MVPLGVAAHADHLQPQRGRKPAKLALQHAREYVPGEALVVGGRKLRMQFRLAQRGFEPPCEVGVARRSLTDGVDGNDRREILAQQRPDRNALQGNGFHGRFLHLASNPARRPRS